MRESMVREEGRWRVIASGDLQVRIADVVRHIADSICACNDSDCIPWSRFSGSPVSLAGGRAGIAVFLAEAFRYTGVEKYAEHCVELVECAIGRLSEVQVSSGLFTGLSGVAWAVDHSLRRIGYVGPQESVVDVSVDEAILAVVRRTDWSGSYDLVDGLVGLGVYALERRGSPLADRILGRVLEHLDLLKERTEEGCVWRTRADDSFASTGRRDIVDLGIAHGLPGVVSLLAECARRALYKDLVAGMLPKAVNALLAMGANASSAYTYWWEDDIPARTGWCYGDTSVQVSVLRAALAYQRKDWYRSAMCLGERVQSRAYSDLGVRDPAICHGQGGLAHIANAVYQATGDARHKSWATQMIERTVEMCERRSGEPINIWEIYLLREDDEARIGFGYLQGASGVGLCLLASVSSETPRWDTPLMISVHPS